VFIFGLKFLVQLISLGSLLSKHRLKKINEQYFVETDKNISPFSFFNIIIYNKFQFSLEELEQVINHEKVHVKQWHTLDTLLSHLLVIVLWFNPFVWLFKKAVQQNLEFLADSQALKNAENQRLYQFTLLKTCTNNFGPQLVNNFYNSFIKKRILMLQKNRSTSKNQWKYALVLPLIAAFVFTFNTKTVAQESEPEETQKIEVVTVEELQETSEALVEIITKDFKKSDLQSLKERLKKEGIEFSFSQLKYNENDEIVKLSVKVRNENGKTSATWEKDNEPIPNIKVGTVDGRVIASSSYEIPHAPHYSYTLYKDDVNAPAKKDQEIKYEYKFTTSSDHPEKHKKQIIKYGPKLPSTTVASEAHGKHEKHEIIEIHEEIHQNQDVLLKIDEGGETQTHEIIIKHKEGSKHDSVKAPVIIVNGKKVGHKMIEHLAPGNISTIEVTKEKHGKKGEEGIIYVTTKEFKTDDAEKVIVRKSIDISHDPDKKPLIFIDGKESSPKELENLDKENIESINVTKGKEVKEKYGDKGENGVIQVRTKK
jgi:hypothetical protein